MFQKDKIKYIKQVFEEHQYVMTTEELRDAKIYYTDIRKMLDRKIVERVWRGYYHWIDDQGESEIILMNRLFPNAIYCMDTALFYFGYSDRTPMQWNFMIEKNTLKLRTGITYPFIKAYYTDSKFLTLGRIRGEIDGAAIYIYDRERTICDVLKYMNKMDKETVRKAIQNYINDPHKNIINLINYAKKLRVEKKVRDLIDVWL